MGNFALSYAYVTTRIDSVRGNKQKGLRMCNAPRVYAWHLFRIMADCVSDSSSNNNRF